MMSVVKCRERALSPVMSQGFLTLYIRRDIFPDQTFEEYAYIGPADEVAALAERAGKVDIQAIDDLLHKGKSFEDALTELGV